MHISGPQLHPMTGSWKAITWQSALAVGRSAALEDADCRLGLMSGLTKFYAVLVRGRAGISEKFLPQGF